MAKNNRANSLNSKLTVLLILFGVVDLVLLIRWQLIGKNVELFNPKGPIAHDQFNLLMTVIAILLAVAIPTIGTLYYFAWKYRETNSSASYDPDARHSKFLVPALWLIPISILILLTSIMWPATHRLEPQKAIASSNKPITIQVVAMQWKWLFIYPEQQIATVNYVQIPVDTPIRFELTADQAPMSSFWIPQLGGQLYAMTGHSNPINLMASQPGTYNGGNAEINGSGFSGMRFKAFATTRDVFDQWTQEVQTTTATLDDPTYHELLQPSEYHESATYILADSDLYGSVIQKYHESDHSNDTSHSHDETTESNHDHSDNLNYGHNDQLEHE